PEPGGGLTVLEGPVPAGPVPAWAGEGPVGPAYLALRAAASAGGDLLGAAGRSAVLDAVAGWDGGHPPLGGDPAGAAPAEAEVPPAERPAARLALLAALAPYRITDGDVAAWRAARRAEDGAHREAGTVRGAGTVKGGEGDPEAGREDGELTRVLAFGAITATLRVESWITAGARAGSPAYQRPADQRPADQRRA
ncbi:hypothetical protein ACFVHB_24230, partial [Kitasatospora sp. NPDC127111]